MEQSEAIKGTIVVVLDSVTIKGWSKGKDAIGFMFPLTSSAARDFEANPYAVCSDDDNTYCINYELQHLRIATSEEVTAYQKGIQNIKDLPKSTTLNEYQIY